MENKDLCRRICSFFAGIHDVELLGKINKALQHFAHEPFILNTLVQRNIEARLPVYGLKFCTFTDLLWDTDSVVSGELILHCIEGNQNVYSKQLLCIYVHRWSVEEVHEFLIARKYKLKYRAWVRVRYIRAYQGPRTVHVMVMNESEFPSQVVNLMNFYDGKFIYMKNPIDVVRRTGTYNQVSCKNKPASQENI